MQKINTALLAASVSLTVGLATVLPATTSYAESNQPNTIPVTTPTIVTNINDTTVNEATSAMNGIGLNGVDYENFNVIDEDDANGSFSFQIEEDGQLYQYEQEIQNLGTDNEDIVVKKFLLDTNGEKKFIEQSTANVNQTNAILDAQVGNEAPVGIQSSQSAEMVPTDSMMQRVGSQGVTIKWYRMTVNLNSTTTKKIVHIINDSQGATGAIAGIGATLRAASKLGRLMPYVTTVSGALWGWGVIIKKISANGTYGISFTIITFPRVIPAVIPWRNS